MNPTNFSGLFGGGGRSLSKASGDNGGDAEMVTPLGQSPSMTTSSSYLQAFHAGTAPTMGVPPLELTVGLGILWQQQNNHADKFPLDELADDIDIDDADLLPLRPMGGGGGGDRRGRQRCRHRHFSLEDYCHNGGGHESEDSNLSSLSMVNGGDNSTAATEVEEDANHSVLMSFRKHDFSDLASTPTSSSPFPSGEQRLRLQQQKQPPLSPLAVISSSSSDVARCDQVLPGVTSLTALNAHLRLLPELRARLARLLEAAGSSKTETDNLKRRLDIPAGLLDMVASHVIQEAEDEPYGLNGCVLRVFYEGHHDLHSLGSLDYDPNTVPTFEISLTLRECPNLSWGQRVARRLSLGGSPSSSRLDVGTSYRLVKKRKYRQQQLNM